MNAQASWILAAKEVFSESLDLVKTGGTGKTQILRRLGKYRARIVERKEFDEERRRVLEAIFLSILSEHFRASHVPRTVWQQTIHIESSVRAQQGLTSLRFLPLEERLEVEKLFSGRGLMIKQLVGAMSAARTLRTLETMSYKTALATEDEDKKWQLDAWLHLENRRPLPICIQTAKGKQCSAQILNKETEENPLHLIRLWRYLSNNDLPLVALSVNVYPLEGGSMVALEESFHLRKAISQALAGLPP